MTEKKLKTVRRTVIVVVDDEDTAVGERALQWEAAGKSGNRQVYRIERATPGPWVDTDASAYLIDMQLQCKGANRNDFTKFVDTYLPEALYHFITE